MGKHSSLTLLHKLVRIISFLLLLSNSYAPGTPITCPPSQGLPCEEAEALQSFLKALGVTLASSITRSYCNDTKSDASTINITCNCSETVNLCHITEIVSTSSSLSGYIHEDVSYLGWLEKLDLSTSQLGGIIPDSLGTLSNLTILNLQGNQLNGPIPDTLADLTNLTSLDLSSNQLSVSIPHSLGNLSKLTYFVLYDNKLNGSIPDSLGDLRNLTTLDLSSNQLIGTIPQSLGKLQSLTMLFLYDNKFSGSIPDSLGDLRNLTTLDLSSNQLIGPIPQSLAKLQSLTMLVLYDNKLSGSIPDSLEDLRNLTTLDLSSNQLTGPIPKSLGKLQSLTALFLFQNLLSGTIPPSVGDLSSLVYLDLSTNNLTGQIPTDLAKLSKLDSLCLSENQLYGPLPPELGRLKNLEDLEIMSNNFNGTLPGNYSQLTSLQWFSVGGNNLSGPIPNYFKNWVNLSHLILMGNNFEGPLPQDIFSKMSLDTLWVSDLNSSSFPIPDSANLSNIYSLILRNCSINGSIPKNIGTWSSLTELDLSFNSLTGGIPESMKDLKKLKEIYLTGNMLNGDIHRRIYQIKGDLSYNNFTNTGPVKQKIDTNDLPPSNSKINFEPSRPTVYHMKEKSCNGKKYDSLFINSGGEEENIGNNSYHSDTATTNYYESQEGNWAYSCFGHFMFSEDTANNYIKNTTCGISVPEENIYKNARLCPISLTYYGFCLRKGSYNVMLQFAEIVFAEDKDYSSLGKRVFDVYIQGVRKLKDFNIKGNAGGTNNTRVENFITKVEKEHNNTLTINFFWAGKGSISYPPFLNGPLISAISITPIPVYRKQTAWEIVGITVASVFALLLLLFALLWRIGLVGNKELYEKKIEIRGKYYSLKQLMEATRNFNPSMEIGRGQFGRVYKAELPDQTVTVKKLSANSKQVIHEIETEVYALKSFKHENLVELLATYCRKGLNLLIYEYMEHKSLKEALFDSHSVVLPWEVRYNICLGVAEGLKYLHGRTPRVIHRNIKASIVLLDGSFKAKISDFGLSKLYEEENPYLVIGIKGTLAYMAPEYATRRAISDKVDVYSFGVLVLEIVSGRDNATYNENQETVFLLDEACVSHTKGRLLNLVDRKLSSYDRVQVLTVLNLAMMCIDQSPTLRPTMSEVVDVLEGNKTIEQISKVATPSE